MDWDRISSNWLVHASQAQENWNLLGDGDLEAIGGNRDKLISYLEDLYGFARERAEDAADRWSNSLTESATLVTTKLHSD